MAEEGKADKDWRDDWEGSSYAPDYVPGTHPIEKGEVTWHHIWAPPPQPVEGEESAPPQ